MADLRGPSDCETWGKTAFDNQAHLNQRRKHQKDLALTDMPQLKNTIAYLLEKTAVARKSEPDRAVQGQDLSTGRRTGILFVVETERRLEEEIMTGKKKSVIGALAMPRGKTGGRF